MTSLRRLLAANQSGELVKGRPAEQASIPATSITSYLDALASLFLIDSIPAWTPNLTRREIGRSKMLVCDSALAMRLSRLTPENLVPLIGGEPLGALLEGFVAAELLKQAGWSRTPFAVSHYRDRNGLELDLILEIEDGSVIGVEVKASSTYRAQHFSGLTALPDKLGSRFRQGIVLGTDDGHEILPVGGHLSARWRP